MLAVSDCPVTSLQLVSAKQNILDRQIEGCDPVVMDNPGNTTESYQGSVTVSLLTTSSDECYHCSKFTDSYLFKNNFLNMETTPLLSASWGGNCNLTSANETKAENSFISTDRVNTREEGEKTSSWRSTVHHWSVVRGGTGGRVAHPLSSSTPSSGDAHSRDSSQEHWIHQHQQVALVIILIRAGLELDPAALRKLKGMVFRLAVVPSVVEIASIAVLTHYLLNFPWIWGFLLGSVLAAVSPAVVIPCLFSLAARGYGTDKGIPTLIVAAASFDDIIAISVFGILISIIFSTGEQTLTATLRLKPTLETVCNSRVCVPGSLTVQIIRGPAGLILGLVFGILWAVGRWLQNHFDRGRRADGRIGVRGYKFRRRWALGVYRGGLRSQLWLEEPGVERGACQLLFLAKNPVAENFALIWTFFQPILFSLIGTEINIFVLEVHTVGLGLVCLMLALLVRKHSTNKQS
uniref:Cation/H+ exchanger transmembrane domain-containing protein n=1 Tax=Timema monikensis TaxID=170555 RepID=A0A7R9EAD4_9NEOP|nr:unnamed protein product [Timema monikensis]